MATFILLGAYTDQGMRAVKETTKRAQAIEGMARKVGATVKSIYWTWGQHDVALIVEAPDEAAITALVMSVCSLGNIRYQTLRAFSAEEMDRILDRMI